MVRHNFERWWLHTNQRIYLINRSRGDKLRISKKGWNCQISVKQVSNSHGLPNFSGDTIPEKRKRPGNPGRLETCFLKFLTGGWRLTFIPSAFRASIAGNRIFNRGHRQVVKTGPKPQPPGKTQYNMVENGGGKNIPLCKKECGRTVELKRGVRSVGN